MRSKPLIFVLTLASLFFVKVLAAHQIGEAGYYPACLGSFCLDSNLPALKVLIGQHGKGVKVSQGDDVYYCYITKGEKAFVKFFVIPELPGKISGVLVSKVPNCSSSQNPKTAFKKFSTSKGISLGDSIEKVFRAYGKPSFVKEGRAMQPWFEIDFATAISPPLFDSMLLYDRHSEGDLSQVIFYVRDGYVTAIKLAVTE